MAKCAAEAADAIQAARDKAPCPPDVTFPTVQDGFEAMKRVVAPE